MWQAVFYAVLYVLCFQGMNRDTEALLAGNGICAELIKEKFAVISDLWYDVRKERTKSQNQWRNFHVIRQ